MQPPAQQTSPRAWTILSLIEWAGEHLRQKGFDEARLHVELLLARVLKIGRMNLYLQFDRPLNKEELAAFKELFQRRLTREPLQYILGDVEFRGRRFAVDRRALIPRPETEELVGHVLDFLGTADNPSPRILDIGTGSGVIAVSLAREMPGADVVAMDISGEALALAAQNAAMHAAVNVRFVQSDVFDEFLSGEVFDCIVANPPYVSAADFAEAQAEVREFEPVIATTDGGDGVRVIRRIAEVSAGKLNNGGRLMMEIGHDQSGRVRVLLEANGFSNIIVKRDFAGIERFAEGTAAEPGGHSGLSTLP